jgi:hypothetical protein
MEKFWMVWGTQRGLPTRKHDTKESAQAEAMRLATKQPGELFVVLAAVDAYVAPILSPERVPLVKPSNGRHYWDTPF